MKTLLTSLLLSLLALTPIGCTGMAKVVAQLKDDPAAVSLEIVSPVYGTLKLTRVGQLTNAVTLGEGKLGINGQSPQPIIVVVTNTPSDKQTIKLVP